MLQDAELGTASCQLAVPGTSYARHQHSGDIMNIARVSAFVQAARDDTTPASPELKDSSKNGDYSKEDGKPLLPHVEPTIPKELAREIEKLRPQIK